ncbi:MacB-like core domain-containing protein [bacterium A37T11]|nr:MacB-like core domain-containing protein [bacterium A37T11]
MLTESRARQYFPGVPVKEVLGKTIIYNHEQQVTVSGIVADLHYSNSFDWQEFFAVPKGDWYASLWEAFQITDMLFVKLEKGVSGDQVIRQLNQINTTHNKDNFEKFHYKQWYELLPLKEAHFSDVCGAYTRTANKPIMIGLLGVAIFLILLACINYINLSTA